MSKYYIGLFFFVLINLSFGVSAERLNVNATPTQIEWYSVDTEGNQEIHLYFFWSKYCPHCHRALPLIPKLEKSYPWLKLHSLEVSDRRNVRLYVKTAESLTGERPYSVPGFLFCEKVMIGYGSEETTGARLKQQLEACYQERVEFRKSVE